MRESTIPRPARQKPRGRELERLVLAECGRHNAPVVLEHVAQAARRIPGKLIAICGPCDFIGTIRGSGRAIVFDCKECNRPTSFDASGDHLPQHQVNQLVRHGRAGAVAGLMILRTNSFMNFVGWLDWTLLENRKPTYPWTEIRNVGTRERGIRWSTIIYDPLVDAAALPASADRGRG